MEFQADPTSLRLKRSGTQVDLDGSEGESSDSGDDETRDQREKKLRKSLTHALQDIEDGKIPLPPRDPSFDEFAKKYGDALTRPGKGDMNALHLLADGTSGSMPTPEPNAEPNALKHLVVYLVTHPADLLAKENNDGHTPLWRAIKAGKPKDDMVEWMCNSHPKIGRILEIKEKNGGQNCLHLAVTQKRHRYLPLLIEKASATTVAAKDSKGNTPLHYAVEYKRCRNETWVSIVKQLVGKGDEIMRSTPGGDFNKRGLSPYLHHIKTRKRELKKEAAALDKERIEGATSVKQSSAPPTEKRGASKSKTISELSLEQTPSSDMIQRLKPIANISVTSFQPKARIPQLQPPSSSRGLAEGGEQPPLPTGGPQGNEPAVKSLTAEEKKAPETSKPQFNAAENVEQFLKLHYLRTRDEQTCIDILYNDELTPDFDGRELNFNLSGRTHMTEDDFERLMSTLRFQDVLQYVEVPGLKIGAPSTTDVDGINEDEQQGRKDLSLIFKKLRSNGVKRVLKVAVDDTMSQPHSDEVIEESLKPMEVEIWDWKRIDLCSEVIFNAAPTVREVYLYSSGNNAVLRSWSDEGGLKRLTHLKRVHVDVKAGIETPKRLDRYIDEFVRRMDSLCRGVEVTIKRPVVQKTRQANRSAARSNARITQPTSKSHWDTTMKEFRRLLIDAENNHNTGTTKKVWESIETPIKIALIDDGVDIPQLDLSAAPCLGGRTFCPRDGTNDLCVNHPHYASSAGHGTIMAKSILEVCPRARLFVLRLEDRPPKNGNRQITAQSAVKAIRAAVRKGVDIISMSWTIDADDTDPAKNELERAIKLASDNGILMFCSAKDSGADNRKTYPAKATSNIFKIGAAKDSGMADEWVGDVGPLDFTFPGSKTECNGITVFGSSIATAYAAGLAALILYCVQVRLFLATTEADKAQVRKDFEALKKHDNMSNALGEIIGTTKESEHKFVKVWDMFSPAVQKRDRQPDKWLKLVAEVGRKLCARVE